MPEHEAVGLRLGQDIGAFHFQRVLRGEDVKRLGQRVVLEPMVTSCSCITWSIAAGVLGGVRLISSARIRFEKIGPGRKVSCRLRVTSSSSMMSVPVISEGIKSGVN